jgi:hypothetical protein
MRRRAACDGPAGDGAAQERFVDFERVLGGFFFLTAFAFASRGSALASDFFLRGFSLADSSASAWSQWASARPSGRPSASQME